MPDRELLRQFEKETLIDMLEDSSKNWLAPPTHIRTSSGVRGSLQYQSEGPTTHSEISCRKCHP